MTCEVPLSLPVLDAFDRVMGRSCLEALEWPFLSDKFYMHVEYGGTFQSPHVMARNISGSYRMHLLYVSNTQHLIVLLV